MIKRLTLAVIALSCAAGAAVYPKVPEPYFGIASHRSFAIGRPLIAFLLPAAAALSYGIFSLSRRDAVRDRSASFEATYQGLLFRIVLFIVALHAVVLVSLVSGSNLASRAVPVLLGLALIVIGDLLPRLRPNIAIGLRTPATFLNRAVWMRTHRVAGYATVGLGAVIVLAGLFLTAQTAGNVVMAAGLSVAIVLAWYCRRISRSPEDRS
jgi:uncharacterized membrane protein